MPDLYPNLAAAAALGAFCLRPLRRRCFGGGVWDFSPQARANTPNAPPSTAHGPVGNHHVGHFVSSFSSPVFPRLHGAVTALFLPLTRPHRHMRAARRSYSTSTARRSGLLANTSTARLANHLRRQLADLPLFLGTIFGASPAGASM